MIPTPSLSHLTSKDYDIIYEPAEDTFLFLDALEAEAEDLKPLEPTICLEIGSGSGCVSTFLAQILGPSVRVSCSSGFVYAIYHHTLVYLCTDINPHACRCTSATGTHNQVSLECINTSFASSLTSRLQQKVDIVLFNPPYVPTDYEEARLAQQIKGISGAWAGGHDGMHVTNVFLELVKDLLSDKGRFYLVVLEQNNVPEIQQRMLRDHGLESYVVLRRRAGGEQLFVLCFVLRKP